MYYINPNIKDIPILNKKTKRQSYLLCLFLLKYGKVLNIQRGFIYE